jgi:hypothetical protein
MLRYLIVITGLIHTIIGMINPPFEKRESINYPDQKKYRLLF